MTHKEQLLEMAGAAFYRDSQDALLAGADALDAIERIKRFMDELRASGSPVLHGFAYQLQQLLEKKA